MNKAFFTFLITSLILASLSACKAAPSMIKGVDLPLREMNRAIQLLPGLGWEDIFKESGLVLLELMNMTEYPIRFAPDYGVHTFIKENEQWIEVNELSQWGEGEIVLAPKSEYPSQIPLGFLPSIDDGNETASMLLRVIVIGTNDRTKQRVGAYIDITLPR